MTTCKNTPPLSQRQYKALVIACQPGSIRQVSASQFQVASQSKQGQSYQVFVNHLGQARCSCVDSQQGNHCKHALAVEALRSAMSKVRRWRLAGEVEVLLGDALTLSLQADAGLRPVEDGLAGELILLADKLVLAAGQQAVAA